MKCISCNSSEVDVIETMIDNEECNVTVECHSCNCVFSLRYELVETIIIEEESHD